MLEKHFVLECEKRTLQGFAINHQTKTVLLPLLKLYFIFTASIDKVFLQRVLMF
jgi:hypothetical protein